MVCLLCDFKILQTVFNQSYNCQTSHYLGRNGLLILPLLVSTSQLFAPIGIHLLGIRSRAKTHKYWTGSCRNLTKPQHHKQLNNKSQCTPVTLFHQISFRITTEILLTLGPLLFLLPLGVGWYHNEHNYCQKCQCDTNYFVEENYDSKSNICWAQNLIFSVQ